MLRIIPALVCALCIVCHGALPARGQEAAPGDSGESRPFHVVLAAGGYASLGGPASYGPNLALDLLPGSLTGRLGLRGEWRGSHGYQPGAGLLGLLYEAGASRPQLVLNLVAELGLTDQQDPIVGGGVETCLWILGPVGVSSMTDVQVIINGLSSRPALSFSLALHIGR